jgi:hypothetical protein
LDEFSVNAYWSGRYRDCIDASLKMLATGKLAGHDMRRAIANARVANDRLPGDVDLGSFTSESFAEQHALMPASSPRSSRLRSAPRVLIAILAKQKELLLPLYLKCMDELDYPKSSIFLYIRTNNSTDKTEILLRKWVNQVGHLYAGVEFDAEEVEARVEEFGVHEWNPTRFGVLGHIRDVSLRRTLERECDFYFSADVDNFIRPCTLHELVALDLPIVAPFLRSIGSSDFYSNYHADIDSNGYYRQCDQYFWILNRWIRGVQEVPVVNSTYLVRADKIGDLKYHDGSSRNDYVIFSESARKAGAAQYLDNRQIYGYITFAEGHELHFDDNIEHAAALLRMGQPAP